jgi:hypothetical protein
LNDVIVQGMSESNRPSGVASCLETISIRCSHDIRAFTGKMEWHHAWPSEEGYHSAFSAPGEPALSVYGACSFFYQPDLPASSIEIEGEMNICADNPLLTIRGWAA